MSALLMAEKGSKEHGFSLSLGASAAMYGQRHLGLFAGPAQGGITMLVLTRKTGDQIVIDGNIIITVVEIWNGKVRLGIEAPRDKIVMRRELLNPPLNPPRGSDTPTE